MTASTTTAESDAYLAAVRVELDDLPEEERTDLLEDLAQHLADMEAERAPDGPSLTTLLGPPDRYAAELRSAADLPPRTERKPTKETFGQRLGRTFPARISRRLWHHRATRHVREFVPELKPAWWVLRGYLLIAVPALWSPNGMDDFPVPTVGGSDFLGFWFTLAAIVGSVWLGRRPLGKRQRQLVLAGNALLVIFALTLMDGVDSRMSNQANFASLSGQSEPFRLVSPYGPVTNILPYAADGTPLDGVLLYDQDGRPLRTDAQLWWPDGCERVAAHPRAADGVGVEFSYPKDYVLTGSPPGRPCLQQPERPNVPIPAFGDGGSTAAEPSGGGAGEAATGQPSGGGAGEAATGQGTDAGTAGEATDGAPVAPVAPPAPPAPAAPAAPA
ncbi:MAG TPA: hypothetical protein VHL54_00880 [Actinomycetota bacterium]|nr:hypothetical protein [Actinomycetota bacterium]